MAEKVRKAANGGGPVWVNSLERPPPRCAALRDYFGLESRMAINRLLRPYLEQVFVTPTELLHSSQEMQRLRDRGGLFATAVEQVAELQTRGTDVAAEARRVEIVRAADQIFAQARRAEALTLPRLGGRFSEVVAATSEVAGDDMPGEYLAMVVLSRDLLGMRDWAAKLDRLSRLAADENDLRATLLLDTVIADVLGANVVQELVGRFPSLGGAIIAMLDFADGTLDTAHSRLREVADRIKGLLADGRLPGSRLAMIDRALKQLRSAWPLSQDRPEREMEEYQRVLGRLMGPGGLLAGADAAEAITLRGTRFKPEGEGSGPRAAIYRAVQALPDIARGVMYLAELSKSDYGGDYLGDIVRNLDKVYSARVIDQLVRQANSPRDRLLTATSAFNATLSSTLPEAVKRRVATHIDGVLLRYLMEAKVIERLDNPADPLRVRAVRLVKFVGAGVLPNGKALGKAREHVIELLRQPQFDRRFVEGIADPAEAEQALRDFHTLLTQAGFGG